MTTARTTVGLLLAALLLTTAAPDLGAAAPTHRSLAGRLLVATDVMGDTRFAKTVICATARRERSASS
jgi:hypothetical protein